METLHQENDERSKLAGNNKLDLLLFRLGNHGDRGQSELHGINVFKIREIVLMAAIKNPIVPVRFDKRNIRKTGRG